jgi:hypothetical protein
MPLKIIIFTYIYVYLLNLRIINVENYVQKFPEKAIAFSGTDYLLIRLIV